MLKKIVSEDIFACIFRLDGEYWVRSLLRTVVSEFQVKTA